MKRPKLADMTPIEEWRFRLLQRRRFARRTMALIDSLPDEVMRRQQEPNRRWCQTVIALTKPAWVANARPDELLAALRHIVGLNN
jgi:hypothetical protein